jgi:hypothetical protein
LFAKGKLWHGMRRFRTRTLAPFVGFEGKRLERIVIDQRRLRWCDEP